MINHTHTYICVLVTGRSDHFQHNYGQKYVIPIHLPNRISVETSSLFMISTSKCKHYKLDSGFIRERRKAQQRKHNKDIVYRY